jgi:exoribonuclease II
MFDKHTLAQLSELKTAILASKEYGQGTVVGSNGRFGFVKLDDGRDAFLNPDKMQRLLPGDKVKVLLTRNDKDQLEATVEALEEAAFKRFVGEYKTKGNNHFVVPDIKNFSRWIFLPPPLRGKAKDGERVLCELVRHPYDDDGKAAAKVVANLGSPSDPYFEHKLIVAQYGLFRYWPKEAVEQAQQCRQAAQQMAAQAGMVREDLTQIPFVTIDSYSTRDMDDAVFAEPCASGFRVLIAIADPASFIPPGSPIAKGARDFAQTVYLPGEVLPMLPDHLATEAFSLVENAIRPALVCEAFVAADGAIERYRFCLASIRSRLKCNYPAVADLLTQGTRFTDDSQILDSLLCLQQLAEKRLAYREANNLVHEDQPDYDLHLDAKGKIDSIIRRERSLSHKLIEEAMLIINLCAGETLAAAEAGLHTVHPGVRPDRLGEVRALLKEELDADTFERLNTTLGTPDGFKQLFRELRGHAKAHLLSPIKRMCGTSGLSTEAGAHCNQGYAHYATVSSPLRRYADLSNHWTLAQLIAGRKAQSANAKSVERLNESLDNGRQAQRELEQWLKCHFASQLVGQRASGMIRVVTPQGFGVKLDATGIEGFVQIPKNLAKQFDAKRLTLKLGDTTYALDTPIEVVIEGVQLDKKRIRFEVDAVNTFIAEQSAQTSTAPEAIEKVEKTDRDEIADDNPDHPLSSLE